MYLPEQNKKGLEQCPEGTTQGAEDHAVDCGLSDLIFSKWELCMSLK